jgi:dissimilatory sulfite reductase related protein
VTQAAGEGGGSGREFGLSRRYRHIAGRRVLFDNEGFLWTAEDWSDDLATALAAEACLAHLTDQHWTVLRFLRQYYVENGRAPLNRQLTKGTGLSLLALEGLFPGGIRMGARRMAGLPNPKTCL